MQRFFFTLASVLVLAGCLSESPEQYARDSLPPDDGPPSPEHRPGQPCLLCHGADYAAGRIRFEAAGTVYLHPDDTVGQANASVTIVDAAGVTYQAVTNAAGNFMLEVDRRRAPDAPVAYPEGYTFIPTAPTFPLQVTEVRTADAAQPCNTDTDCPDPRQCRSGFCELATQMTSTIHREGSCAGCHYGPATPESPGAVYIQANP